jgi:hypothetical protein
MPDLKLADGRLLWLRVDQNRMAIGQRTAGNRPLIPGPLPMGLLRNAWPLALGGIGMAGANFLASNKTKADCATLAFDVGLAALPFALPKLKSGVVRMEAEYHFWRLQRNEGYTAKFFLREVPEAVLELAVRREVRFEIGVHRANQARLGRWLINRGASPAPGHELEVGVGRVEDYHVVAHNHPLYRFLYRMPSGADINGAAGPESVIATARWPRRLGLIRQGPIARTHYRIVGRDVHISPEHPDDFTEIVQKLAEQGFAEWNADQRTIIVRGHNHTGRDRWVHEEAVWGYNRFYGYWRDHLAGIEREAVSRIQAQGEP